VEFVTSIEEDDMELFALIPLAVAVGVLSGLSLRALYN